MEKIQETGADLVGLSFSIAPHEAAYVPLNLDPPFLPPEEVLARLRPVLTTTL